MLIAESKIMGVEMFLVKVFQLCYILESSYNKISEISTVASFKSLCKSNGNFFGFHSGGSFI
jgi:hypothetical protein